MINLYKCCYKTLSRYKPFVYNIYLYKETEIKNDKYTHMYSINLYIKLKMNLFITRVNSLKCLKINVNNFHYFF